MNSFRVFLNESVDVSVEHDVINMYQDQNRYKISEISSLTGISTAGIYRILEKYGISPHRGLPDNTEIVRQYASSGASAQRIAELTGYSTRHIYNIMKRFTD